MTQEADAKWLTRGREHQRAGRLIDALVCYRRALSSNEHAMQAQFRLGEVLRDLGQHQEARAVWLAASALNPTFEPLLLSIAGVAHRSGAHDEALDAYQRLLAAQPENIRARIGLAVLRIAQADESAYADLGKLLGNGAKYSRWDDLATTLAAASASPARTALLRTLAIARAGELPPLLLGLAAEAVKASGDDNLLRDLLSRAESLAHTIDDLETLRRFALAEGGNGVSLAWAQRYTLACIVHAAASPPVTWPRRTAGEAVRIAYLIAPEARLDVGGMTIDPDAYLRALVARHSPGRYAATVYVFSDAAAELVKAAVPAAVRVEALGALAAPAVARAVAESDHDALIDLVGMKAPLGVMLARRPARTFWTYSALSGAHVAPLITLALPPPDGGDQLALAQHRLAVEEALHDACASQPWFMASSAQLATELTALWRAAVASHESGDREAALSGYRDVLAEQPDYAPAQHLRGVLLSESGKVSEAEEAFTAAIAAAPAYSEPRVALARLYRDTGRVQAAGKLCVEGLALAPNETPLWRALGQTRLAQRRPRGAHAAFRHALALAPADGETHYNQGVAFQMWRRPGAALRAYQRALALAPGLAAADFNIGVIFREQGRRDAAIRAFEHVLARNSRHVPAYKALAEVLLAAGRIDEWLTLFDRFAAACPDALPLAVVALQACQYRGDFAELDRYLDRLQSDEFTSASDTELADSLEELLYLLLFFDVDSEFQLRLYERYDAVAARVYGSPLQRPEERRPGKIRLGYLSGDLRDHVMGKMMWSAIERHDRDRFELFFYSLSSQSDEWTERYRGLSEHFEVIAPLSEEEAAERIGADDLDLLVDLASNTYGAKPGILALKPARVQITHVATAWIVGLSTIDFKLTDGYADLPESQAFQLETLLPMQGCVYPYRHLPVAAEHPFHREQLGLTPEQVVIGAFVNPLKLSRRCLARWREILDRIPNAVLAISPRSAALRAVYGRLLSTAGIASTRVCVVSQGRSEAENQARYNIIDFVLDPMPFGGANGTLEPLDMGVPVVALAGRRHGERCAYSILANLGVTHTVARSGSEYVEIAVRLASDAAFAQEVRAAIRRGLERSALTDMEAHARHLEQAYLRALEQNAAALAALES